MKQKLEKSDRIVSLDPYDHQSLRKQLSLQQAKAFDIETDVQWDLGIDQNKFFLPLDADAIAFPGASFDQALVLSQYIGLVVNSCIAEMEDVATKLRHVAWRQVLESYPVNPEMYQLGEQFFDEEAKHSLLFSRFIDQFCHQVGVDRQELDTILPKAYGSIFQRAIRKNAMAGGHAFWWVVALVEEVSVLIYQQLYRHRREIDPLFYQVHRRHFEEESRHTSYAFMMLELIKNRPGRWRDNVTKKLDLLYSELFSTGWVLAELHKVHNAKQLASKNEFFATLKGCLPLLSKLSAPALASRLFISAPYISLVLNRNHHKLTAATARQHRALHMAYPFPKTSPTYTTADEVWEIA